MTRQCFVKLLTSPQEIINENKVLNAGSRNLMRVNEQHAVYVKLFVEIA